MPDVFALRSPWRGAGRSPLSEWPLACGARPRPARVRAASHFPRRARPGAGVTRVGREGAVEGADLTGGGAGRSRAAGLMAMPASASNPGGANVFTSRPGDSGGSGVRDTDSNIRASSSAPGCTSARDARRIPSATASAIALRCASLAPRTFAGRPLNAATCAFRSAAPLLARRS